MMITNQPTVAYINTERSQAIDVFWDLDTATESR